MIIAGPSITPIKMGGNDSVIRRTVPLTKLIDPKLISSQNFPQSAFRREMMSRGTHRLAKRYRRPCLSVDLTKSLRVESIQNWIAENNIVQPIRIDIAE